MVLGSSGDDVSTFDNKLKKNFDPKKINSILLLSKEKQDSVIVWKIIGNKKVTANVKILMLSKASNEIKFSPDENEIVSYNKIIANSENLNFYIPSASMLFQVKVKNIETNSVVKTYLPSFIAQVERRQWLRLNIEEKHNVRLQFNKKIDPTKQANHFFAKKPWDIGGGGLSFLLTRSESKSFFTGEIVKNLEILIDNEKFKVDAEVIRLQVVGPSTDSDLLYKTWKVSLKLTNIQKRDQEALSTYIFKNINNTSFAV